jgi:polar amino acid transport system substrate-binding protein
MTTAPLSRRWLLGALVAAVVAAAPATGEARELQEIIDSGTLRVGFIPSPPSTIKDPMTGELSGIYVDGVRAIAELMGIELEFVETTWGTFSAGLQADQFDLSIGGTFATVKRAMAVDFTQPLFYLGYGALVRADEDRFQTLEDMNDPDVRIATVQGGSAEDFVRRNMPEAELVTLATGNLTAPFVEVISNRADVAIEDTFTIDQFVAQQPGAKNLYSDNPYNFTPISWAVAKGNRELLSVIDAGIDIIMANGVWDDLARPYSAGGRYIDAPNFAEFPRPVPGAGG